jgi:diaminohydroxyphosphoribosylaminopyrimidine deaminase/5-amino-6-(5-phosphoribosylamino)uracil reductase
MSNEAHMPPKVVPADPERDRRFMAAALRLGRRNLGQTYPNPAVGSLIVAMECGEPVVVGRGWTARGGRPHAETIALEQAGDAANGATAYVSLEPCSHQGETRPCAQALIDAKVARVVTAMEDPDPRVAGKGHEMLVAAGVALSTGVLADEAARVHAGHISRVTKGRPHVTLKLAVSADGMIGKREGERMIITGKAAFDAVQTMRTEADIVMIGIGTALVDDPRLTVRLPGLSDRSPVRVVLDATARLKPSSNLVQSARDVPLIVVVGAEARDDRKKALEDEGAKILEVGVEGEESVDIGEVLETLAENGFTRVFAEGGAQIASSLVADDLLDDVVLIRAPVVVGQNGVRALGGYALSAIERSPRFRLVEQATLGEDQMRRYLRAS